MQIPPDIWSKCEHNPEAGGWWMMFGLSKLHFIREEDKLWAKCSALCPSCSPTSQLRQWDPICGQGGVTHWWRGETLSYSLYCIVCRPHGSLKGSWSAQWWWIASKYWKFSRVSCFLLCLLLDTVWSLLSADLPQALLRIQWTCTSIVWLISPAEKYVDF